MKKLLWVVLIVAMLATSALADPVSVSVGPVSTPYGAFGPYYGNVTDPNGTVWSALVCFSQINGLQTPWSDGLEYTINTVGGQFGKTTFDYNVIAYLANKLFDNPGSQTYQEAIWYYMGFAQSGSPTVDEQNAIAEAIDAVNNGYITSDTFLFAPNSEPGVGSQPFIRRTPEPATLALLGTGVFGLALRRRRTAK